MTVSREITAQSIPKSGISIQSIVHSTQIVPVLEKVFAQVYSMLPLDRAESIKNYYFKVITNNIQYQQLSSFF